MNEINIESKYKIHKINNRIFSIGDLDFNSFENNFCKNFIINISNLLSKGNKFIPCYFSNNFYFYSFIFNNFNSFFQNLNSKIFFAKKKFERFGSDIQSNNSLDLIFEKRTIQNLIPNIDNSYIEILIEEMKRFSKFPLPLQEEIVDLEFEIFKNYHNFKYSYINNNITKLEFISIKQFLKKRPFKVVECDKNLGSAICSNQVYSELCVEHLNNTEFFTLVDINPLSDSNLTITGTLIDLKINLSISKQLYNKALPPKESKLGKFRILPKLHKSKFGTRPIVNCIDHPTSNLAKIIDFILQPFVRNTPSFIQDSQYLINELNKLTIESPNYNIYAYDIVNLYMNIILNHVLTVICEFMSDKLNTTHIKITGFHHILKLILFHNYFSFENKYYLQIKGIAMGCKCAPTIANLYLSLLEKNFLTIHKPFFYKRFLDDLLLITSSDFNINNIFSFFHNLELTLSCKDNVNFLDLNISIDFVFNRLKTSLYIKPTQTFSFLLNTSNHPSFIFKNIPKGILIRIRRNCTELSDFFLYSNIYLKHFLSRGYNFKTLCKTISMISNLDRNDLLKYKNRSYIVNNNEIISKFPFDLNTTYYTKIINESFLNLSEKYKFLDFMKIKNSLNMQPNIGAILIHNIFSFNFNLKNLKFLNCNNINCNICTFSSKSNTIKLKDNIKIPISCSSNCSSSNIIYIIKCKKCPSTFYIGQSSRSVSERIKEHIRDIKYFIPYEKHCTNVSYHFNLLYHNLNDFTFYIFSKDLEDKKYRLHIESKLIYLFKNILNVNVLNTDFPCPHNNLIDILI